MNREKDKYNLIQEAQDTDTIEMLLQSVYSQEAVPGDLKLRLKNRIECQKAMNTGSVSFWWLPATLATTISFAVAVILCVIYVVVNINGSQSWMPNFLQFVSEIWLKLHLVFIALEVVVSWVITFFGVWKGNLVKNARIM